MCFGRQGFLLEADEGKSWLVFEVRAGIKLGVDCNLEGLLMHIDEEGYAVVRNSDDASEQVSVCVDMERLGGFPLRLSEGSRLLPCILPTQSTFSCMNTPLNDVFRRALICDDWSAYSGCRTVVSQTNPAIQVDS
jgi:hypothetical protein